jgi:hypothetical protein
LHACHTQAHLVILRRLLWSWLHACHTQAHLVILMAPAVVLVACVPYSSTSCDNYGACCGPGQCAEKAVPLMSCLFLASCRPARPHNQLVDAYRGPGAACGRGNHRVPGRPAGEHIHRPRPGAQEWLRAALQHRNHWSGHRQFVSDGSTVAGVPFLALACYH